MTRSGNTTHVEPSTSVAQPATSLADADIGSFAHRLIDEVHAEAETDGTDLLTAFTSLMLDQFCADGITENAVPVHFRDHGVEVSGWGTSSDDRCLDLFLVQYSPRADDDYKIDRGDADAAFKRLENFLLRCTNGVLERRDTASEVAGMGLAVAETFRMVDQVRFILISNARSVLREHPGAVTVDGRRIRREVWDLRRLANWAASGSKAEPIVAEFPDGVPCLPTPGASGTPEDDFRVYLAIVAAADLADLYATHGARLLELNVRSFLQIRGTVNRGILETLRNRPERFVAYNNGIAATASSVDFDETADGHQIIRRIHNLQIVNGGQTTATIHQARRAKIDISSAHVQMKLTVVPADRLDDIVPQISAYSNTQNKVSASDLKANSAFHVDIERIMRTLWAPATAAHPHDTHWFYERARGQYANAVAAEVTPARQKIFKTVNPATQKFVKSDVAKFEHSWGMLPHMVSLGAEKNFVLFSEALEDRFVEVDKDYCRHLVAKAILFRRVDRLVAKQSFGGYKANIVTYTVAKLVHATCSRLDLDRIWREQDLSLSLQQAVTELSRIVQRVITSLPEGRTHVGEWTKRPECWHAVRDHAWAVPADVEKELVDLDDYAAELALVRGTTASDWADLAEWGAATGHLEAAQCRTVRDIGHALARGWDPAGRQLRLGVAHMRHARAQGFRTIVGF
jgi:hypothetical protein